MKGNFRQLLKRFCLEGSVLGLKFFYLYPGPISRCFWAITLLLSLSTACVLSVLLYRRFEEMPTRITIENQYEPLHNLAYPAITICSPNQITISALKHLKRNLVNGNLTFDLDKMISQILGFNEILDDLNIDELKHFQNIIKLNRYTALNIINILPQSCSDFLRICYFERKIYNCSELFHPVQTQMGVCCAFNSVYYLKKYERNERKPNFITHMTSKSGIENSLTVITDYNPEDAVDSTVINSGATRILFTDWEEFPVDEVSTLVYSRAEFYHILSAIYTYGSDEVQQLPVASRKCYFKDEFKLPYFENYGRSDCDLSCLISEVKEHCQCTLPYVPRVDPHHACNFTSLLCIKKVKLEMSKAYQNERCRCIRDCVSRKYRVELVTGNLDAIKHIISPNFYSKLVVNDSTTVLHFYFPTPVYTKQKQETVISLISLAANLGGVFGLSLGCSFLSLIEIGFFIYMAIKNYIRKRLNMKRRNKFDFVN